MNLILRIDESVSCSKTLPNHNQILLYNREVNDIWTCSTQSFSGLGDYSEIKETRVNGRFNSNEEFRIGSLLPLWSPNLYRFLPYYLRSTNQGHRTALLSQEKLYPPHGLFACAHSPTQLNGTPSSTERVPKIKPHLFPHTIESPQPCLQNLELLRYACKMHFVSYHAWKHLIFDWQPAYTTCRLNVSITALTASRAKYRGLAVIKYLINFRRPYSYHISIKWTALESACCSTKYIIVCSVSLSFMRLIVPNHLLLDATEPKNSSNKT